MGLFRKRRKKPTLIGTRSAPLEQRAAPERARIDPIPLEPPIIRGLVREKPEPQANRDRGSDRTDPDYRQYDIQDPRWSEGLRKAFDLTGGAGFALASEIVPVHVVAAGGSPGAHHWAASVDIPAVTGEYGAVRIKHTGTGGRIVLDVLRFIGGGSYVIQTNRPPIGVENVLVTPEYMTEPKSRFLEIRAISHLTFSTWNLRMRFSTETANTHVNFPLGLVLLPGSDYVEISSLISSSGWAMNLFGRLIED